MICRQNYHDTRKWLDYERDVRQVSEKTVSKYRGSIRHLLEWADSTPFTKAHTVRPSYPVHLRGVPVVRDYKAMGRTLSKATIDLACLIARDFFTWARRDLRHYKTVEGAWVETLRPGRLAGVVHERELYTIEEVRALVVASPGDGLREKREKAAVALLFLSGMRVGAFVTLPISALDLVNLSVKQWPELGVATKNSKAATTYLLNIPDLLDVVRAWDDIVRPAIQPSGVWYAKLEDGMGNNADALARREAVQSDRRRTGVEKGLRQLCKAADIPYRSPHKLRHGFAVYSIKRARTIADFKAISQNLMHANLSITDGVYGILTAGDVQGTIAGLAGVEIGNDGQGQGALIMALENLLATLKKG